MNIFDLDLQEVDDYIPILADHLKIGYKQELGEYKIFIPKDFGKGIINCVNFPNGIGLYIFNVKFRERLKLRIRHKNHSLIRFLYMLKGTLGTQLDSGPKKHIKALQHFTIAPIPGSTQEIFLREKEEVVFCYIEVDRRKYKDYCDFDFDLIEPRLQQLFDDVEARREVFLSGTYGINVYTILEEILDNPLTGFPRINYLGGKSLTALSQMILNYQIMETPENFRHGKKEYLAVQRASTYIRNNLHQLKNIKGIAQESGVNPNKLQQGFQKFKGKSINSYIHDIRMKKAMQLLLKGEDTVIIISEKIGLKSRSYFAKSFKEQYGLSPKEVLQGFKNKEEET